VAVAQHGRIIARGTSTELLDDPHRSLEG
jgi:hypothetical protein